MMLRRRAITAVPTAVIGVAVCSLPLALLVAGPTTPQITLTSSRDTFTITSHVYSTPSGHYPADSCAGAPALLTPGVTRCIVYTVHNVLPTPITVRRISMGLDHTFPRPPSGCSRAKLTLPAFAGALTVDGGGQMQGPGLPIALKDTGSNQDNCKHETLHFAFSGRAVRRPQYGLPGTGAELTSSQVAWAAGGGLALMVAGAWLVLVSRRRRDEDAAS